MKRLRPEVIVPDGSARGIKYAIACVVAVMSLAAVDAGFQLAHVERQSQAEMAAAAARVQRAVQLAEARRASERARRAHVRAMQERAAEADGALCPYAKTAEYSRRSR